MLESFLKKVSLFSQLNEHQLQKVAAICVKKTVPEGTVLFQENESGAVFYILFSGSVKIYTARGGEEKILSIFSPGDSFGELSLLDGKPRSASAKALEVSVLYALGGDAFLDLLRNNFEISLSIMQELCQRLHDTNQHVHDLTFLDARSRVLKNLITLANKQGKRSGAIISIPLTLNFDELAQMAGVQKNVLMEVLRDLQQKEIVNFSQNEFALNLAKLRG